MKKNDNKKTKDFFKGAFRWLGFSLCEIVVSVFNLLIVWLVAYYCWYAFGPVERIRPQVQNNVSIKKVDGFYLVDKRFSYDEIRFPDCKVDYIFTQLEFKKGDVYDGDKCVTNLVEIQRTDGGFRLYYLKRSYPLNTIGGFDWSYYSPWKINSEFETKEMYIKNGEFYVDVDERHEVISFILLIVSIGIILVFRCGLIAFIDSYFHSEYLSLLSALKRLLNLLHFKKKK